MDEVGAEVVATIGGHQHLSAMLNDSYPIAKKRALPFHPSSFLQQRASGNWNPKSWNWDSASFVAKPLQCDGAQVGNGKEIQPVLPRRKEVQKSASPNAEEVGENLRLKLGGGAGSGTSGSVNLVEPQPVSRPNKRVRSGSPGSANYPMCQVDNCNQDLSTAKDYHRRHKVCGVHSKAGKALVGSQMQRFCQQCSRFHTLSEFDEGKRSCRRRLAGHNSRRRKTQPEDTTPRLLVPVIPDIDVSDNDMLNLLAALTRAQGNTVDRSGKFPSIPDKDQLVQILNRINSLPLSANLASKLNGSNPNHISSDNQNQTNRNAFSSSTMDLLAVLSEAPGAPSSDAFEIESRPITEGSDSERSKLPCFDQSTRLNMLRGPLTELQEALPSLPLQLFSPSPENCRFMKLPSDRNFLSSGSFYSSEQRSPPASPPVIHDLFPMQTSRVTVKNNHLSNSEGEIAHVEATIINGCSTSLQLFGGSMSASENVSVHSAPSLQPARYTSSSGSDHLPSSPSSDAQDRTGRIIFKLFDMDPGHLPGSLRAQIYNWLSNSPSEMESYIRPGCVVLSLYLSMPTFSWDEFEENLLSFVKSLIKDINVDFWGNGRFLVHTDRQMASYKEGKVRLCKSWKTWIAPELISVSPVAIVGGQETSLLLRGRSLIAPGTRIHCTHADGYSVRKDHSSSCQKTAYDEIILDNFKVDGIASSVLGRCFIEVENGLRGASFPVIIADSSICQELRLLEPEINRTAEICDGIPTDCMWKTEWLRSRKEGLHFLDELGWLFQRRCNSYLFEIPEYRLARFRFLLVFSVEHDFCALVKTLLDILLELNLGRKVLAEKSLELLSEINVMSRAVRRKCRRMVDLLLHYPINDAVVTSEKFIFVPNMAGPGGITPLHLAACMSSSDDIVDALTNDPQEVGLLSWNYVLDANGLSPYAYAVMRNNHSYNALVARKLADRENGQLSLLIEDEIKQCSVEVDNDRQTKFHINRGQQFCSRCAVAESEYGNRLPGSKGLLQRPYIHSVLAIGVVCVCVCVLLRGHPYVGCFPPFAWENLGYGSI